MGVNRLCALLPWVTFLFLVRPLNAGLRLSRDVGYYEVLRYDPAEVAQRHNRVRRSLEPHKEPETSSESCLSEASTGSHAEVVAETALSLIVCIQTKAEFSYTIVNRGANERAPEIVSD
ncbi:unnamed protein product [Cyprideis torosa]|uniref:Uncharacterized protein n=1 Tax=Cyprideis torosa TaxID=163714 RepID=A0A7R8W4X6_9CRUS|nr:unnamed protein product [Cyprideis torosa]CAG0882297.1 unnamed protein product [Cyprideis torosa]